MVAIEDVMALLDDYVTEIRRSAAFPDGPSPDLKLERLLDALRPIIADAQHYRSLQGKTDGASEPQ